MQQTYLILNFQSAGIYAARAGFLLYVLCGKWFSTLSFVKGGSMNLFLFFFFFWWKVKNVKNKKITVILSFANLRSTEIVVVFLLVVEKC